MRVLRIACVTLLVMSVGVPATFAGDLRNSVAKAATAAAKTDAQETPMTTKTGGKSMLWGGTALFATGMTFGLYQFINNKNGSYAEFGEANATNKKAGAAGLSMAFAGGALMLIGHHAAHMPSLTFGGQTVGLAKKVSW